MHHPHLDMYYTAPAQAQAHACTLKRKVSFSLLKVLRGITFNILFCFLMLCEELSSVFQVNL